MRRHHHSALIRCPYARITVLLWLLLVLWVPPRPMAQPAATAPILFERFDHRSGLPNFYLTDILEDDKGFLWIGASHEVLRYDGRQFRVYGVIEHDLVDHLRFGPRHGLWTLSIWGALHRYLPRQEKFAPVHPHFPDDPRTVVMLNDLRELRDGSMWAVTRQHRLCRFDPATGRLTPHPLVDPAGQAYTLHRLWEDPTGDIWIAAQQLLLHLSARDGRWQIQPTPELRLRNVLTAGIDPAGRIWFDERTHTLARYDPRNRRVDRFDLTPPGGPSAEPYWIQDYFFAADGRVWLATNSNGLLLLDPATGRTRPLQYDRLDLESLSSNGTQSIHLDRSGSVWISTWGGGLNRFQPANQFFRHYRSLPHVPTSLSHPEAKCFLATPDGSVWIGTRDGLNRLDPVSGRMDHFFLPKSLLGSLEPTICALAADPRDPDRMWVGTMAGLFTFSRGTGQFSRWIPRRPENKPLREGLLYFVLNDRAGRLWAISYLQGIYSLHRFVPEADAFEKVDLLPPEHPNRNGFIFRADRQHTLWIDTPDSVFYRYDLTTDSLTTYVLSAADTSGFNSRFTGQTVRDGRGQQWFGSPAGLHRLLPAGPDQPVRFRRYTVEDGLVDRNIMSMLLDSWGKIWIGTMNGLSRFDPATETFQNYHRKDGLQADEFVFDATYLHPATGEVYLGGVNGFNVFRPDRLPRDTLPPAVVLTGIEVLRAGKMESVPVFDTAYAPITHLELNAAEKVVRFEFAALHFADPDRNQYAYRLEGFDADWRYSGTRPEATYTNLDPGPYRLWVKAASNDGVWSDEGVSLSLYVRPPWWATWWARLLYAVGLVAVITALYREQRRRLRVKAETERIRMQGHFKTQFYTNITHEFRTPLTVILGMVRQLRDQPERYLESGARLIERNGRMLLGLINQLLDLSRLDEHELRLQWQQGDIVPYLHYLVNSFESYAAGLGIGLTFASERPRLVMDYDPEQLQQIVGNLVGNALKFTSSGGEVVVRLRATETVLQLSVRDTGIGIPAADLPHIFDRFYQADRRQPAAGGGTGIGLAHTRALVELMGGTVAVASRPGEGSEFTVTLPIHRRASLETHSAQAATPLPPPGKESSVTGNDPEPSTPSRAEVLLIEDNADVVTYLVSCLEDRYYCRTASNGQLGIDQALETVPDLIICDVMMPERDGFEVCETLKNDPRTSHIPIILLTARADADSRLAGLRRGADVYLAKPFDRTELLVRIDRLLLRQEKLAAYYARQLRAETPPAPAVEIAAAELALENDFVRRVRELVAERYGDENFALPELCRAIGMSRSQLYRKMQALCGISPSEFIRSYRLEQARELLRHADLNVSEVAWRVGYRDPSYFTKSFQEAFGHLPSEISPLPPQR